MLKLGIVGAGIIGKSHGEAILKNKECTLTVVCDTVLERAQEVAAPHGARCCTDYKEICGFEKPDAVILNLPHFLHHDAAVFFLEHGVHVLVEKPMAISVEECDSMAAAAEKNGVKLAVGHVQKYYSAYSRVKELAENKKYGKLCMITEVRNVDYLTNRPKWFLDKKLAGGGIVMNYGAHTLDKIMYVTGERVTEVCSIIDNPLSDDNIEINAQILLRLSGGISANILYCGCHGPYHYETVFYFTNGVAKVDEGYNLSIYENGKFVNYGGSSDLLEEQLEEFVKYIRGEKSRVVTPEYGREVIRVLEKILK